MHYQHATRRDIRRVVASLRSIDRVEASITRGREVTDAELFNSVMSADYALAIYVGSTPVGLCGVSQVSPGIGSPWLIGTDHLTAEWRDFARVSRPLFYDLVRPFHTLVNQLHKDNTLHRRFIDWLCSPDWTPVEGTPLVRFIAHV